MATKKASSGLIPTMEEAAKKYEINHRIVLEQFEISYFNRVYQVANEFVEEVVKKITEEIMSGKSTSIKITASDLGEAIREVPDEYNNIAGELKAEARRRVVTPFLEAGWVVELEDRDWNPDFTLAILEKSAEIHKSGDEGSS